MKTLTARSIFECTVKDTEWYQEIEAASAGKAKYAYLMAIREAWPDVRFTDIQVRRICQRDTKNGPSPEVNAQDWNEAHPVGTQVHVRQDDGVTLLTKTRSAAQVLGGHTAVVWLDGVAGCYRLDRCAPLEPAV